MNEFEKKIAEKINKIEEELLEIDTKLKIKAEEEAEMAQVMEENKLRIKTFSKSLSEFYKIFNIWRDKLSIEPQANTKIN